MDSSTNIEIFTRATYMYEDFQRFPQISKKMILINTGPDILWKWSMAAKRALTAFENLIG